SFIIKYLCLNVLSQKQVFTQIVGEALGQYRTFYPRFIYGKRCYSLEYRQISRTFDLYRNGRLLGKYIHSDFVLLAVIRNITGYKGDEVPEKYRPLLQQVEKGFSLCYQGLVDE
ncbi:hypothetical protein Q7296_08760, partial [Glaesserella parasuis]|nr:hypothetical protein [Glaesserella parasuis]